MTPLAHLHEILEKTRVEAGLKGMSVAVMHRGELIFADGFGQRNDTDPFTAETLMPIASLTKAFTSAAISELVGEGKMDWDTTPVSTYLPEFAFGDPVLTSQLTLVDLLSHRTGMPNIDMAWFKNTAPRREVFKTLRNLSPPQKLKPYYKYSNSMYAVAGEASANVAGTTWENLVQTKLLDPLGLKNTGFAPSGMVKRSDNYAMPYDAKTLKDAQEGRFEKGYLDDILNIDAAAGDIFSNVLDLVKWGHVVMSGGMLDGKQVLKKESLKECFTPHSIMLNKMGRGKDFAIAASYGLAWELDTYKGNNFYFHTGSLLGFRGSLALYPDADIVVAFLTNTHKSALRTYIPFYIVDQLLRLPRTEDWLSTVTVRQTQVEYDEFEADRTGARLPARVKGTSLSHPNLEDYAGEYSDPVMGIVTVSLFKDIDPKEKGFLGLEYATYKGKMDHYHYDTFRFTFKDFGVDAAALARFSTGPDGRVNVLSIVDGPEDDDVLNFKRRTADAAASVVKKD
ncbi:beta-lactamase/transpeptidase-like protein [Linnemannia elongata AG-77]|uniref:Beta-lactamase/transpeptidase-like protein n=1 Tax=Linnemannia elongata AG-77 TaxID=1314771 RepID=A0A197JPC5_9FUNG|nr:beta-lactamase/transpeptidase-like protein [Linnemannia elongata AG-77]